VNEAQPKRRGRPPKIKSDPIAEAINRVTESRDSSKVVEHRAASPGDAGSTPAPESSPFTREWPDPTEEMLKAPEFEAVWQAIKFWDINVPDVYSGYCGATGNHVRAILDALAAAPPNSGVVQSGKTADFESVNEGSNPSPGTPSADGTGAYTLSLIKPRLEEAVGHLEAMLNLTAGFNANHEPMQGWCAKCDGNYLHTAERCPCPCHAARAFLILVKQELAEPKL
jgi:hypothetical protein